MNLVAIISFLIITQTAISKADFVKCNYSARAVHGYTCSLTILNLKGLNNFTEIEGRHLKGYGNEDVRFVYHSEETPSHTINFPSIICKLFPNLKHIVLYDLGIQKIFSTTFNNCKNLMEIFLRNNDLQYIEDNSFIENRKLLIIKLFGNKKLTIVPEKLYINQKSAEYIDLDQNHLSDLPKTIFQNQRALKGLWLSENYFKFLRPEWFQNLENLEKLYLFKNPIESLARDVFKGLKNIVSITMYDANLKALHSSSFGSHPKLLFLNFKSNQIVAIETGLFKSFSRYVEVDLRHNTCASTLVKDLKLVNLAFSECFVNYQTSLAVCRREVEILGNSSSNAILIEQFDSKRLEETNFINRNQLNGENVNQRKNCEADEPLDDEQSDEEQSKENRLKELYEEKFTKEIIIMQ